MWTQSVIKMSDFCHVHENLVKVDYFLDTISVSTPFLDFQNKFTFAKKGEFLNTMLVPKRTGHYGS